MLSVAEWAIPFWQKWFPSSKMLRVVEFIDLLYVVRLHPAFENVVTNDTRVLLDEVFYGVGRSQRFAKQLLRPDQKSVSFMKYVC